MTAINVARTDTFEQQRVKINEISTALFNVTSGGSDLSTGNLKLGDGTLNDPSLAFVTDASLGIYKSSLGTLGFGSDNKRILNLSNTTQTSFVTIDCIKTSILDANVTITSAGSGYGFGTFTNVGLTGGIGSGCLADITVDEYAGTLTPGINYTPGTFNSILLLGGNGSGATIQFTVEGVTGTTNDSGSGYADGQYLDVPLTGGNGTGLTGTIDISGGQAIISINSLTGQGYQLGDLLGINDSDVGSGGGSGFEFEVTNSPYRIDTIDFVNKGSGYLVGDQLTLPVTESGVPSQLYGEVTGVTSTLVAGSAQITVADTSIIKVGSSVTQSNTPPGELPPGATVLSIDSSTTLTLSGNPVQPGAVTLTFTPSNTEIIEVPTVNADNISPNDIVTVTSGSGTLAAGTTVVSVSIITGSAEITLSQAPTGAGSVVLQFSPPFGSGSNFLYTVDSVGSISEVTINDGGIGYKDNDILSVQASDLVNPIEYAVDSIYVQEITFSGAVPTSAFSVGDTLEEDVTSSVPYQVRQITTAGGNIVSALIDFAGWVGSETLILSGNASPTYTLSAAGSAGYLYTIDGNITPDLTLYVNAKYKFNTPDPSHTFAFSTFPDGKYSPSLNSGLTATLSAGSTTVVLSSTTGVVPGMTVEQTGGSGTIPMTTVATVVDGTTITVEDAPTTNGTATVDIYGSEYTDGVIRSSTDVIISITDTTPSPLYYYCQVHENMGGSDGNEAVITIDPNNPNPLGSGFQLDVGTIDEDNNIKLDVTSGKATFDDLQSDNAIITTIGASSISASTSITTPSATISSINSPAALTIDPANAAVTFSTNTTNVNFGNFATLEVSSGNFESAGTIKTSNKFISNDLLEIEDNNVLSTPGNDLLLTPASGRIAKVDSNAALVIPAGNDLERPTALAEDGSIRFNTDTNQYEGYSATNSSWSSLGGVRDLDGNTYILAEETVGANDNTLWFINDNVNTIRVTPQYLEFVNVNQLRSLNPSNPVYSEWIANSPVLIGDYIKYKNNLYEVTTSGTAGDPGGTLGTSGNEPTHTSGAVTNGTAELTWNSVAVNPIVFEDFTEFRIDPTGSSALVVNSDLRFSQNTISTDINDLAIRPNSGKKIVCDAPTSLVLPSGIDADRGVPIQGSVRFSQTTSQFEGYDGSNWGSLGGVKDVDQNTYIIPESAPGANENTLFFYNDNAKTLEVTTTAMDFYGIDTIRSVTSDELEITASLLTFDQGTSTFDNTATDRTFLHTTKQYFDLGLSAGLTTDPVLRLDDQGDVFLNVGFGTGNLDLVKIFDGDLKEFELADVRVLSEKISLVKGTINNGSSELYPTGSNVGCKTTVAAHNTVTGDKEFIEFGVLDDGTDIFHTTYGNIRTGIELIVPTFEVTGTGVARLNIELGADVNTTDTVNVVIVSNVTKK